jgi:hypothetical protein
MKRLAPADQRGMWAIGPKPMEGDQLQISLVRPAWPVITLLESPVLALSILHPLPTGRQPTALQNIWPDA